MRYSVHGSSSGLDYTVAGKERKTSGIPRIMFPAHDAIICSSLSHSDAQTFEMFDVPEVLKPVQVSLSKIYLTLIFRNVVILGASKHTWALLRTFIIFPHCHFDELPFGNLKHSHNPVLKG